MSPVGVRAGKYTGHGKARQPGLVTHATQTTAHHAETTAIFGETKIKNSSAAASSVFTNSSLWASVSVLIRHPADTNSFKIKAFSGIVTNRTT